jgi:hypothetical protein
MSESEPDSEFEPETLQNMIDALAATIRLVRLSEARSAEVTLLAAKKIIELARAGERDAERLKTAALDALQTEESA